MFLMHIKIKLHSCMHVLRKHFHLFCFFYFFLISGTLFVTGALDGTVVIWSMNSLNMVKRFECVEDQGYEFTMSTPASTASSTQLGSVPVTHIMTLCEVSISPFNPLYILMYMYMVNGVMITNGTCFDFIGFVHKLIHIDLAWL